MKLKTCPIFLICSILYFVYGIKTVHAVENLYYLHQDHLGSTSLVTDSTGKAVSKQSYYPYGATRSQTSDVGSKKLERQYTGQVSDEDETGLYYYNARYYNPTIAKFTQADNADTLQNRYAYVRNNPTSLVDPSGNSACVPWDPNCWKEAFTSDFRKVKKFVNNIADTWANDPEGFTDMLAETVLTTAPQVAAYYGAMYVAGPQAAEALDTTLCALSGDAGTCVVMAQAAGPNVSRGDDLLGSKKSFGELEFSVNLTDRYTEGPFVRSRVDEWIGEARSMGASDETSLLYNLNKIINKEVTYNKGRTNWARVRSMLSLRQVPLDYFATCKFGVCSQKQQFMFAAMRRLGLDPDFLIVTGPQGTHAVVRYMDEGRVYFFDSTLGVVSSNKGTAWSDISNFWKSEGFNVKDVIQIK